MNASPDMAAGAHPVRPVLAADLGDLAALIDATGLFPSDMLPGMAAPYLAGQAEEIWLRAGPALAYAAPERLTQGTWNLLLIAVHPAAQRRGAGTALVRAVMQAVAGRGGRLLLVETSGLDDYAGSRAFYRRCGFTEEARIRGFYRDGDDKIVFIRPLGRG